MSLYRIYYIPFPHLNEAEKTARQLLEERSIACANIFSEGKSLYWWQGKIEKSSEVIMILKTYNNESEHEALKKRIHDLHPYDCPCITALEGDDVNKDFLQFLRKSTTNQTNLQLKT